VALPMIRLKSATNTLPHHRLHGSASTVNGASLEINKMLSYRSETVLQAALVLAKSGRLELGDNTLRTL